MQQAVKLEEHPGRRPSKILYDLIIKQHKSSVVLVKCVIDEYLYAIIRDTINAYGTAHITEEEESKYGH
jgi:hypothetical protein